MPYVLTVLVATRVTQSLLLLGVANPSQDGTSARGYHWRRRQNGEHVAEEITRLPGPERDKRAVRSGRSHVRAGIAVALLAGYAAVILLMTMSPTPVDRGYESSIDRLLDMLHRGGVPEWFGYSALEFTANLAMFVPLGLLIGLALPQRIAWHGLILLPAFSAGIELTQALLLSQRYATIEDVIANSIGGWIGLLIVFAIRAMVHARDRKMLAPAERDAPV